MHKSRFQIINSRLGLGLWIYWSIKTFSVLLLLCRCLWIAISHLSQASSRSSQSQQQAATWLRSPCLFTYSQQHNVSSSFRCTLVARFFMTDSPDSLLEKSYDEHIRAYQFFVSILDGGVIPNQLSAYNTAKQTLLILTDLLHPYICQASVIF